MTDPEHGWLARRDAIQAGIDNPAAYMKHLVEHRKLGRADATFAPLK